MTESGSNKASIKHFVLINYQHINVHFITVRLDLLYKILYNERC